MNTDRRFGLLVGGAFALLGAALGLAGSFPAAGAFGAAGIGLCLLGAAAPALLAPVHRRWMAVARFLGRVNTALFLGLVFFLVLTPLGVVLRLSGRDELTRRNRRATGWVPCSDRNRDPRHFEKMF